MSRTVRRNPSKALVLWCSVISLSGVVWAGERSFETAFSILPADVIYLHGAKLDSQGSATRATQFDEWVSAALARMAPETRELLAIPALLSQVEREVVLAVRPRSIKAFLGETRPEAEWWLIFEAQRSPVTLNEWARFAGERTVVRLEQDHALFFAGGSDQPGACGGTVSDRVWLSSSCGAGRPTTTLAGENEPFLHSAALHELLGKLYWPDESIELVNFPMAITMLRDPALRDSVREDPAALERLEAAIAEGAGLEMLAVKVATRRDGVTVSSSYGPSDPRLASNEFFGMGEVDRRGGGIGGVVDSSVPTTPFVLTAEITPPELEERVEPVYPEAAKRGGLGGKVILQVVVDEAGWVRETKVLRSAPGLDQAAVEAVRRWRYRPATKGGRPVAVYLTVVINFALSTEGGDR